MYEDNFAKTQSKGVCKKCGETRVHSNLALEDILSPKELSRKLGKAKEAHERRQKNSKAA